jgi:hypothetical protein
LVAGSSPAGRSNAPYDHVVRCVDAYIAAVSGGSARSARARTIERWLSPDEVYTSIFSGVLIVTFLALGRSLVLQKTSSGYREDAGVASSGLQRRRSSQSPLVIFSKRELPQAAYISRWNSQSASTRRRLFRLDKVPL